MGIDFHFVSFYFNYWFGGHTWWCSGVIYDTSWGTLHCSWNQIGISCVQDSPIPISFLNQIHTLVVIINGICCKKQTEKSQRLSTTQVC